jgi:hypothetical protein
MQPDAQFWQSPCACDRIGGCRAPDHQTRCCQDPFAMRAFNRLVDFGRRAEIIGSDD